MAWTTTLATSLRVIIGDMDSTAFTDARLQTILVVGASYVNSEINWAVTYTITLDCPAISPDPTLAASLNEDFSNLTVLKAACLLNFGELRTAAIKSGIEARCGPAILKTGKHSDGFNQLIAVGPCKMYEELANQYRFEAFNTTSAFGVLSPFVNDDFHPSNLSVGGHHHNHHHR